MKILVLHQYFVIPGMPGGSRFNEFARLWTEGGHEVTVIAGALDYTTRTTPDRYRGRWLTKETDGEAIVWRCHVPSSYGRSYVGRMWAFFGVALSALTAVFRVSRPDAIIATSPPLTIAIPAWFAARVRFRRVPWVFEVRDLWPESAVTTGVLRRDGLLTRLLYRLERWACASADHVNVLTPAFREDLMRRHLVPDSRVGMIPNGADTGLFSPGPRDNRVRLEEGWGDRFVVLYSGAHGRANAVGQLVEAAELLRQDTNILIACVGDGPERERWEQEAKSRGLQNIRFLGPRAKERMPEYVRACDAGAAVLQRNPTFMTVYPNKVFDYMVCAKPVLLAIDGVARALVCDEASAGVFVEPEAPASFAEAVRMLASDPDRCRRLGSNGHQWATTHATRESLASRYLDLLQRLVAAGTRGRSRMLTKGLLDRGLAAIALLVLSPLLAVLGILVRLTMGPPALFRQQRPGLLGRPFTLLKFRTMTQGTEGDEARLTRLGRFLRRTSLDELPELWNVVVGDMSLVGPRPLLMEYLGRYNKRQARRHEVKPGITGWAQINGRNGLGWAEKFELDVWYVENRTLSIDVRILIRTLLAVMRQDGVRFPGSNQMSYFEGSHSESSERRSSSADAGQDRAG